MALDRRRTLILVISALLLISFPAVYAWRSSVWARTGSAGFAFFGGIESDQDTSFGMFKRRPRQVMVVIPGAPGSRAGITVDDEVVSVNGIPLERSEEMRTMARSAKPGDWVTYELKRAGKSRTVRVQLETPTAAPSMRLRLYTGILCGMGFLIISFLVFWTKPRARSAAIFYLMCVVGAAYFFFSSFAEIDTFVVNGLSPGDENMRQVLSAMVYWILAVLLTNLLLHLALVFPKERPILSRHAMLTRWIYLAPILPLVLVVLFALGRAYSSPPSAAWSLAIGVVCVLVAATLYLRRRQAIEGGRWRQTILLHPFVIAAMLMALSMLVGPLSRAFAASRSFFLTTFLIAVILTSLTICLVALAYMVWTVVSLVLSYREAGLEEKRQIRWPLWGTILALGVLVVVFAVYLVVLNVSPKTISHHPNLAAGISVAVSLCYLLIPISFAFGILKYRLMDIDVIIKKTLVYTTLTGVIVAIYLIFVAVLGATLVRFTGVRSQTVTIVSTLAIAALFVPVRNRVQKFVDRRFFRRKYDYPQALRVLSQDISRASDLDLLLKSSAELVQQALQNRFVLMLAEKREPDRLEPIAHVGLPSELVTDLALEKRAVLRRGGDSIGRIDFEERPELRRIHAHLEMILKLKGEVLGAILLGSKLSGEDYDEEDREFLNSVGENLALAIDSLRVRKESQEFQQALDIQRALLPKSNPEMRGIEISSCWHPARTVGGDYFDLLKFDEASVGLCIGDVAGKGMPAALLMSSLQAAVKAIATAETEPSELCTKVRRVVCSNLSGGKFVTFFYAVLNAESRQLRYTNAGHNPPILARSDGSVIRLDDGGPAFARLLSGTSYRQGEIALRPGDRLVLFTDGVSEARSPEDLEFGEEKLAGVIRDGNAAAEQIFGVVQTFTAGELQDDVTIVSVVVN